MPSRTIVFNCVYGSTIDSREVLAYFHNIIEVEVEVRLEVTMIREDFQDRFRPNNNTEDDHGMDKTVEVGQDMILIIEIATGIIQEVIRGMGDQITTIREGKTLKVKITIDIEVGHTKDRTETEGTVEALATVDQSQVQG